MNRIDVGQTITILANVGVLAGMILLAYEIRQNTNAISGMTIQAIADQSLQSTFIGVENPELRRAFATGRRNIDELTPEDDMILGWYYAGIMRIMENRYRQASLGTVDPEVMGQVGGSSNAYRHPYFQIYWERSRPEYSEDFAAWVDNNLITNFQQ